MKQKISSIFVALMFMLSIVSIAFAQDATDNTTVSTDTNVSANTSTEVQTDVNTSTTVNSDDNNEAEVSDHNETETPSNDDNDTSVMTDVPGAQMRVTQLQERIERAVLYGNEIIAAIKAKGNVSTTDLETIVTSLSDLKTQAGAIDSTNVEEATAKFVDIKKQAITLVQQFRVKARSLLGAKELAQLKKTIQGKEAEKLKDVRKKVEDARKAHNAEIAANIAEKLGVDLTDIIAKLKSGEITPQEAKREIIDAFKALSAEKKDQARLKLQEKISEWRVKRLSALDKAKARVEARSQNREEKIDQRIEKIKNRTSENTTGDN